ncbi:hypothetical protein PENTCL1PPCAC_23941, partial [Pristionchus entomophagus]
ESKQSGAEIKAVTPQQNSSTKGDDFISRLPDDCLLSIFERFNDILLARSQSLDNLTLFDSRHTEICFIMN